MQPDRRLVLERLAGGAFAGALSDSIAKALAIPASSTLGDVENGVTPGQEDWSWPGWVGDNGHGGGLVIGKAKHESWVSSAEGTKA
jgi:hypothetical protein